MKTLYFDCGMGAAGDMLMGALLELSPRREDTLNDVNYALNGKAVVSAVPDKKCGICATHISVRIDGEDEAEGHRHQGHNHTSVAEIEMFIKTLALPEKVKNDALGVYRILAEAESSVHGVPIENIHFHEVGSLDALADILGVCMLINELAPGKVLASPVNVGGGTVKCAHGILPVPAPATECILRGIPVYSASVKSELCTPTGAALLSYFVSDFTDMPLLRVRATGYGSGKKEFEQANVLRAILGDIDAGRECVLEFRCNIDDMTGEELGFAQEELFKLGAADVYTVSIGMKKSRPAVMLTCMCRSELRDRILEGIFKHTTSLGVREYVCRRYTLLHTSETVMTEYGPVKMKTATGWGIKRMKPEYEDIARIARENNISLFAAETKARRD